MKLFIYRATLNGIKKAHRVTHRTAAFYLWKIPKICCVSALDMLQFHNTDITKQTQAKALSICTTVLEKPTITNIELANQLCKIRTNSIIALKVCQIKHRDIWVSRKKFSGQRDFF
jgi:hypothetical protein